MTCQSTIFQLKDGCSVVFKHAMCELFVVSSSECGPHEIDKGHSFKTRQTPSSSWTRDEDECGWILCAVCGSVHEHIWHVVWQHSEKFVQSSPSPPSSTPLPHPTSELYSPSSKRMDHLGLSFSSSGLSFFLQINALQSTLTDVTLHHFHFDTLPLILPLAIRSQHQGRPSLDNALTGVIILKVHYWWCWVLKP